jgi:hypothetical protein
MVIPESLQFEVKNIHYLEVHPVHQNDVSANEHVRTVRRGWRQLPFEVWGARIHFSPQLHRNYSVYYEPSFHFGRQAIAIPQAGREVIVMCRVPAVHRVTVVIGVEMIFIVRVAIVRVAVVSIAGLLSVAAAIVVTAFVLGQS